MVVNMSSRKGEPVENKLLALAVTLGVIGAAGGTLLPLGEVAWLLFVVTAAELFIFAGIGFAYITSTNARITSIRAEAARTVQAANDEIKRVKAEQEMRDEWNARELQRERAEKRGLLALLTERGIIREDERGALTPRDHFMDLYDAMLDAFGLDDLKILASTVSIEWDNVPGSEKRTKLQALLTEAKRAGKMVEFEKAARQMRPSMG
jgi:uncharacterized protein Smg (DUF494 family)